MKAKWIKYQWLFAVTVLIITLLSTACTGQKPFVSAAQAGDAPAVAAVQVEQLATQQSTSTATPDGPNRQALKAIMEVCAAVQAGQACLGQGPVTVEAQPGRRLKRFESAGDIIDLADLRRLKLGQTGSGDGLVWIRIPAEMPGAAFTLLAFGNVELVNEVPYGSSEFAAMQSLTLAAGPAEDLEQAVTRGLVVQAPHDGTVNTLVINGMETVFGSTAFITSMGGFLSVNTVAGAVGLNLPDMARVVVQGTSFNLPLEQLTRPLTDPASASKLTPEQLTMLRDRYSIHPTDKPETPDERMANYLRKLFEKYGYFLPEKSEPTRDPAVDYVVELIRKQLERQRRHRRWIGGWWKLTYGPITITGNCQQEMAGDGGSGSGSAPEFSEEIPICRANNGRTLLFRNGGQVFERVTPNLYVTGWSDEMKNYGGSQGYVNTGNFQTLQVIRPNRMKLNTVSAESGGCTITRTAYLDFVRDDPKIRCGRVIELEPFETPMPTITPLPIEPTVPPVGRDYTVRVGLLKQDCDAEAKAAAPDFLKAGKATAQLSLDPEGGLLMKTGEEQYIFTLGPTYPFFSQQMEMEQSRLGLYALEQPLSDSYQLAMTLISVAPGQYSGAWQVYNPESDSYCVGSLDLQKPK